MPAVLPLGVRTALSRRDDDQVQVISDGFNDRADRSVTDAASGHWSDYLVGAVAKARAQGGGWAAITVGRIVDVLLIVAAVAVTLAYLTENHSDCLIDQVTGNRAELLARAKEAA